MASPLWDRRRAAHLYRRAGFGGTPEELDLAVTLGREGAVSRLVDDEAISTADLDAYVGLTSYDLGGFEEGPERRFEHLKRWWFYRMLYSPRPLEEKMTLFWHNHFATSITKVLAPAARCTLRTRSSGRSGWGDSRTCCSRCPETRRC